MDDVVVPAVVEDGNVGAFGGAAAVDAEGLGVGATVGQAWGSGTGVGWGDEGE